jgi:hypothetical protein
VSADLAPVPLSGSGFAVVRPTADLSVYYRNPRRGDVSAIMASLERNAQYRPIVVNAGTLTGRPLEVLAGNHTLLAARELDWPTIQCWEIDVDEQAATLIVAADNRIADLGTYDEAELIALLSLAGDLTGTGYSNGDLADLLKANTPKEAPEEFPAFDDETIQTDHTCPRCGYQYSGGS